jgi:hypothetical protein
LSDRLADHGTGVAQDHYNRKATFQWRVGMRKLLLTCAIVLATSVTRAAWIASAFAAAANHTLEEAALRLTVQA